MATRHLMDLGHETVHHITGPLGSLESQLRATGWRATLEAAGARRPEPLIGDWSARAGYHLGRRLTKEINLLGALHPAARAAELTLWNRVVPDQHLDAATHQPDLVPDPLIYLHTDRAVQGIGTGACGPGVLPRYRLEVAPAHFAFTLSVLESTG